LNGYENHATLPPMQPGAKVAHFEIISLLGRGGMGDVFRARDGKLKRDVALRTLPPAFSSDADRLVRFEREATSLAALNHPNIASIYGIEEQDGARYLVLELVEGSTLDERLLRGALPLHDALEIALRIASAMESAHSRGVIHRDLKPANIKAAPGGVVKVLDFGLARSVASSSSAAETKTSFGTDVGLILGTPPYMSPEQARGENAGTQTDIWAFGVILYEMLTGLSPFKRDTIPGTLARVLEAEPDFAKLPASTPPAVRRLLRRCLEKDLQRRTQHIGDVRIELEEALAGDDAAEGADVRRPPTWRRAAVAVALLALGSLGGFAAWSLAGRDAAGVPAEPMRLSIASLERPLSLPFGVTNIAITDDGRRVAYAAFSDRLLVRELGSPESVTIDEPGINPFFSPDGQWVGFWNVDGGVAKVRTTGGEPLSLQSVSERPLGAMWGTDGNIVYATAAGVFRVSENGGPAELLATADPARGERAYAWPKPLPGGRHVLLTVLKGDALATAEIALLDLETRAVTPLLPAGVAAQYAASGHLVFVANQNLQAIEFDAETRQVRGAPVQLPNAAVAVAPDNGAAQVAIARNGTLLLMPPRPPALANSLVWVDRAGRQEAVPLEAGAYTNARVSPDGMSVALDVSGASRDIFIYDLQRSAFTRLTTSVAEDLLPSWSADGSRVFFSSTQGRSTDLYSQAADGAAGPRLELGGAPVHIPSSVTPDGTRVIVYEDFRDLKALVLATGEVEPVLTSDFDERLGEVSPDGRFMAYESDESGGQFEVYVRPFPNVQDGRVQVSTAGGRYPRWGLPGSNELFYVTREGSVMTAPISATPSLRAGASTKLFDWEPPPAARSGRPYDVSPLDGRFLMTKRSDLARRNDAEISVVLNWFTELRRAIEAR
jgi:serine/threonine-protein kinase